MKYEEVGEIVSTFVVGRGPLDELLSLVMVVLNSYLTEEAHLRFDLYLVSVYTTT